MNPAAMGREGANMGFGGPHQQLMPGSMNSMNNIPNGMSPQEWMALQQQQQHDQGINRNFGMQQQQGMRGSHPNNPAYRPGPGKITRPELLLCIIAKAGLTYKFLSV